MPFLKARLDTSSAFLSLIHIVIGAAYLSRSVSDETQKHCLVFGGILLALTRIVQKLIRIVTVVIVTIYRRRPLVFSSDIAGCS